MATDSVRHPVSDRAGRKRDRIPLSADLFSGLSIERIRKWSRSKSKSGHAMYSIRRDRYCLFLRTADSDRRDFSSGRRQRHIAANAAFRAGIDHILCSTTRFPAAALRKLPSASGLRDRSFKFRLTDIVFCRGRRDSLVRCSPKLCRQIGVCTVRPNVNSGI